MRSKLLPSCLWPLLIFYFGFLPQLGYTRSYSHDDNLDKCKTPDSRDGNCIKMLLCEPILSILRTSEQPHPPAVKKTLMSYGCGELGEQKVCCPKQPIILKVLQPRTLFHNREKPPNVTNHSNFHLLPKECGFLDSTSKIVKGEDARLNEFPWMALLQYKTGRPANGLQFLCGGTIINQNYILTAAHCIGFANRELVSVRVGEYSIENTTDCQMLNDREKTIKCNPPVQDLKVEEIISHPQYMTQNENILNDIALLRVSTMNIAENVIPVCLPVGEVRDQHYSSVSVTGWGLTNSETEQKADILQKVGLPVADKQACAATYSESGVIGLSKTQLCAGGVDGKASCSGDSGGPALVPFYILEKSTFVYVQHGIVSVGPSYCGIKKYPGLYILVKFYMDWILDNMRP